MAKIKIPSLEKFIVYKKFYGVLFRDSDFLKYYSVEDNKIYELIRIRRIYSIFADTENEEVYFGTMDGDIYSLFNGFESKRKDSVNSIMKHKNEILDAGGYGLVKTLTGEVLISKKDMERNSIKRIESLFIDENQNLYALVWNKDKDYSIIILPEKGSVKFQ